MADDWAEIVSDRRNFCLLSTLARYWLFLAPALSTLVRYGQENDTDSAVNYSFRQLLANLCFQALSFPHFGRCRYFASRMFFWPLIFIITCINAHERRCCYLFLSSWLTTYLQLKPRIFCTKSALIWRARSQRVSLLSHFALQYRQLTLSCKFAEEKLDNEVILQQRNEAVYGEPTFCWEKSNFPRWCWRLPAKLRRCVLKCTRYRTVYTAQIVSKLVFFYKISCLQHTLKALAIKQKQQKRDIKSSSWYFEAITASSQVSSSLTWHLSLRQTLCMRWYAILPRISFAGGYNLA